MLMTYSGAVNDERRRRTTVVIDEGTKMGNEGGEEDSVKYW